MFRDEVTFQKYQSVCLITKSEPMGSVPDRWGFLTGVCAYYAQKEKFPVLSVKDAVG